MIPYAHQDIDENDITAVEEILYSDYLTTGPCGPRFEEALSEITGADYALAVSSCTAALHLSMMALNVGPADKVYAAAVSFAASANCARYVGAQVDFIDVDAAGLISIEHLEQKLKADAAHGTLPKAVIAVDLAGRPVNLAALKRLKEQYGFYVVEDAAHALGASYQGHATGDGAFADLTVLSFHPVKIITTAEGGAVLTNDANIAARIRRLRSHGIEHDPALLEHPDRPGYYYEMQELGFNYRLTDLQSALGLSQLERLDQFLSRRRELASRYLTELKPWEERGLISLPPADQAGPSVSSWHLFQIRVKQGKRDALYQALRGRGIGVQVHYLPIYSHPFYRNLLGEIKLPGAESFSAETLSLPLYPALTDLQFSLCLTQVQSLLDHIFQEKAQHGFMRDPGARRLTAHSA